jgi:hypothetical protein
LEFLEDFHELSLEHTSCVSLLNAMELEGSDGEETNSLARHLNDPVIDEEMSNLPMEWVDNLTSLRRSPNREVIPGVLTTHDSANPEASITEEEGDQNTQPTSEDTENSLIQPDLAANPRKAKNQV